MKVPIIPGIGSNYLFFGDSGSAHFAGAMAGATIIEMAAALPRPPNVPICLSTGPSRRLPARTVPVMRIGAASKLKFLDHLDETASLLQSASFWTPAGTPEHSAGPGSDVSGTGDDSAASLLDVTGTRMDFKRAHKQTSPATRHGPVSY